MVYVSTWANLALVFFTWLFQLICDVIFMSSKLLLHLYEYFLAPPVSGFPSDCMLLLSFQNDGLLRPSQRFCPQSVWRLVLLLKKLAEQRVAFQHDFLEKIHRFNREYRTSDDRFV